MQKLPSTIPRKTSPSRFKLKPCKSPPLLANSPSGTFPAHFPSCGRNKQDFPTTFNRPIYSHPKKTHGLMMVASAARLDLERVKAVVRPKRAKKRASLITKDDVRIEGGFLQVNKSIKGLIHSNSPCLSYAPLHSEQRRLRELPTFPNSISSPRSPVEFRTLRTETESPIPLLSERNPIPYLTRFGRAHPIGKNSIFFQEEEEELPPIPSLTELEPMARRIG